MNTFTNNPSAATFMANQLIRERVQDAEHRAQVRAVRAARRAARQAHQPVPVIVPLPRHNQPWWAFRFLSPAH